MNAELYKTLDAKEKAFVDLLQEIANQMRRLADLMDKELSS